MTIAAHVLDHNTQPKEEWREGVMTRMCVSALTGSAQLTIFEQWCVPGLGAPTHLHAVEEVLTVLGGQAEVWLDDEHAGLKTGQSLIIPAGRRHGFKNIGTDTLHMRSVLAAPIFEATYDGRNELSRRYVPKRST